MHLHKYVTTFVYTNEYTLYIHIYLDISSLNIYVPIIDSLSSVKLCT